MSDQQPIEQPEQPFQPSQVLSEASRRFVARRDGKLEPIMGNTLDEVEVRLMREVAEGGKEVDLYIYAGTYRPRRTAEKINVLALYDNESSDRV